MKSIRIGNDIRIEWPIVLSGDVSKLQDLDLTVEVRPSAKIIDTHNYADEMPDKDNEKRPVFIKTETTVMMNGGITCRPDIGDGKEHCRPRPCPPHPHRPVPPAPVRLPYHIEDNTLIAMWTADRQFATGDYDIILYAHKNEGGQAVCDQYRFVRLVAHTAQADAPDDSGIEAVIAMQPVTLELSGLSAYEVAVVNGFQGTEEEWLQSLKQPAIDAAEQAKEDIEQFKTDTKAELEEDINNLNTNTGVDEYPVFSESEIYSIGDIVRYTGTLYQFNKEHVPGAWKGLEEATVFSLVQALYNRPYIDIFTKEAIEKSSEGLTTADLYKSIKAVYCNFEKDPELYYSIANIEDNRVTIYSNTEKNGAGTKVLIDSIELNRDKYGFRHQHSLNGKFVFLWNPNLFPKIYNSGWYNVAGLSDACWDKAAQKDLFLFNEMENLKDVYKIRDWKTGYFYNQEGVSFPSPNYTCCEVKVRNYTKKVLISCTLGNETYLHILMNGEIKKSFVNETIVNYDVLLNYPNADTILVSANVNRDYSVYVIEENKAQIEENKAQISLLNQKTFVNNFNYIDYINKGSKYNLYSTFLNLGYVDENNEIVLPEDGSWCHSDFIPIDKVLGWEYSINSHQKVATISYYKDKDFSTALSEHNIGLTMEPKLEGVVEDVENAKYIVFSGKLIDSSDGVGKNNYVRTPNSVMGLNEITNILLNISYPKKNLIKEMLECEFNGILFHISIDDVWICLKDIIDNAESYSSIFENSFLSALKNLHDINGVVFTLNTFNTSSTDQSYDISNVPTKFQTEFQNNKSWLRFSFHAESDVSHYNNIDAQTALISYNKFVAAIYQLTGDYGCIDRQVRLGFFEGTENVVKALYDSKYGITILSGSDDGRNSYYLTTDKQVVLDKRWKYIDEDNEIMLVRTMPRCENPSSLNRIQSYLTNEPRAGKIVEVFFHEYVYNDNEICRTTINDLCEWVKSKGYKSDFITNIYDF